MRIPERRRFLQACAAIGAGAAPWGCAGLPTAPRGTRASNEPPIAESVNPFTLDLYRKLAEERGNLVVSPFSVETALAMVAMGAGAETQTRSELWFGLHLHIFQSPGAFSELFQQLAESREVELNIANAVWGEATASWKKEYQRILNRFGCEGLKTIDFDNKPEHARAEINRWVDRQTKHKIAEILPPGTVSSSTRIVLANAIYFHGKWAKPFQPKDTQDEPFRSDGSPIQAARPVKMMQQTGNFGYFQGEGYQTIELPYRGNDFGLIVILPKEVDGLPALEKQLSMEQFQTIAKGLERSTKVNVKLPRFKMERSYNLVPTLQAMGIREAFTDRADFSGMHSGTDKIRINVVQHKAYIDVAEEGTEAAAATAVTMSFGKSAMSVEPPVPTFHADHPFLYAIRHRPSGTILFIGRMERPG